jgi:hypothetical protein
MLEFQDGHISFSALVHYLLLGDDFPKGPSVCPIARHAFLKHFQIELRAEKGH